MQERNMKEAQREEAKKEAHEKDNNANLLKKKTKKGGK